MLILTTVRRSLVHDDGDGDDGDGDDSDDSDDCDDDDSPIFSLA